MPAIYGRLQLAMNARRREATITSPIIAENPRDRNLSLRVNECILLRNVTGPSRKSAFELKVPLEYIYILSNIIPSIKRDRA